jgi:hypothetical protein
MCQRTYKTRNGLRNHVTNVHPNREPPSQAAVAATAPPEPEPQTADIPPVLDTPMQRLDSAIAQMHGIPEEQEEDPDDQDPEPEAEQDPDQDPHADDQDHDDMDTIDTPYMLCLSIFKETKDSAVIFMIHTRELYVLAVVAGVFVANFSFLVFMLMKNDHCAANRWTPLPGNQSETQFDVTTKRSR